MRKNTVILLAAVLAPVAAFASSDPQSDKSTYTLTNPTPADQLRSLNTERTDKAESGYTVDAGHFQIESALVSLGQEGDISTSSLLSVTARAGITSNIEVDGGIVPVTTVSIGETSTTTSLPNAYIGAKWNFWGNDNATTAAAIHPTVLLPTTEGASADFAVAVPVTYSLSTDTTFGVMAKIESFETRNFSTAATLGHTIGNGFAGYVEFHNTLPEMNSEGWVATFDVGMNYALNSNLRFDVGANFGLTDAAQDLEGFVGVTSRF